MFRTIPNKFRNICFLLFLLCFIFSSNTLSWAECSESGNYLICEDWDSGVPPTNWPEKGGVSWHGWTPAGYGPEFDNLVIDTYHHSSMRCLDQYRASGSKSCGDLSHTIAGNPTVVYIRFYLNIPESAGASLGDYRSHFLFLNTASSARVALDIAGRSREYCAGHCPANPPYSNDDGKGEHNSGYEWKDHIMLSPSTRPPTVSVVETEGTPFFFEDHFDEWVLVEWKVDFVNKKTSLWVNEIPYIIDYDMDWPYSYATKLIISGYSNYTASSIHYYIDDIVVSTSYIGPKDSGPPNEDATPPNTSDLSPARDALNVPQNTDISVHVQDSGDGVDQGSIVMKVNGEIVSPSISGGPSDYALVYDPPSDFGPGQTVSVTIDAQDLHVPANVMPQESYSFTIAGQSNVSPTINSFTGVPSSLDNPGESTTFNVSATDPDGDSLTYTINFGDGTANGHGSQVVHTYEAKGTYTATVTVSDGHGHSVPETLQVTVKDNPPAKPTNVSAN